MRIEATSVDDYISKLPDDRAAIFTTLRQMIQPHLDSDEMLEYGMPSFHNAAKTGGFSIASQKNYISLYVMNVALLEEYRDHFKHLKPGKSCINFKRLDQLPLDILQEMIEKSYSD
jgi:uncharacterized protein YdhG (YjbR/CyaY superfamily)